MKQAFIVLLLLFVTGCSEESYSKIPANQSFAATLNLKDTTISFIDKQYQKFAQWDLSDPFLGGLLVDDGDTMLIYGKDMEKISVYSLSLGKKLESWNVGRGIVSMTQLQTGELAAVNQESNEVYFLASTGEIEKKVKVGKQPQSLITDKSGERLYVINFGDAKLSVLNTSSMKVEKEIEIPSSSSGGLLREKESEIWIGGHGSGSEVEDTIHIYSTQSGKLIKTLKAPTMPIKFIENEDGIFIASHGSSMIYTFNHSYEQTASSIIGANPFEMKLFNGDLLVAGYDSNELYVVNSTSGKVLSTVKTGKGPFQLMIRE
ncbi:YncE family protein [Peribacillus sp. FSL H8-0477]|uniref:YncE family protein n=1 Tax=Peribacillus sp. FSL H8-0477 TaxID=2921388 RepID=UPI0030F7B789